MGVQREQQWDYSLSASKLNILKDCPRCFWLHMTQKIERPRGIYPSLPNGMDATIKTYLDLYRGEMPPELRGQVVGTLWGTKEEIKKLRHWQSGMKPLIATPHGTVSLIGALDDVVVDGALFASLDVKTKGSAAPEGYSQKYYQLNADIYALMFEASGFAPSPRAYFWYFSPSEIRWSNALGQRPGPIAIHFEQSLVTVQVDPARGREVVCAATELLATVHPHNGPKAAPTCEYCRYTNQVMTQDAKATVEAMKELEQAAGLRT